MANASLLIPGTGGITLIDNHGNDVGWPVLMRLKGIIRFPPSALENLCDTLAVSHSLDACCSHVGCRHPPERCPPRPLHDRAFTRRDPISQAPWRRAGVGRRVSERAHDLEEREVLGW